MQFITDNKLGIGIAAAILVLLSAYLAFFRGGSDSDVLLESTQSSVGSPVSRELLITLGDLRTVKLDDAVFSDPAFRNLVDFGVEIPLQPVGRSNPFGSFLRTQTGASPTR